MINTESVRRQMVLQQVRTWDVFDPDVLDTLSRVSRDAYVPAAFRDCAYADAEIPLAHGQCMLRPSLVGRILQALGIEKSERVLEVGTGTGYLTHCLAEHAASVVSIDLYDDFVSDARERLAGAGAGHVELQTMDASIELPHGPFDVVAVTASVRELHQHFVEALGPGGRMFVVVGDAPARTANVVTRKRDGGVTVDGLFETDIPALVTHDAPAEFSF